MPFDVPTTAWRRLTVGLETAVVFVVAVLTCAAAPVLAQTSGDVVVKSPQAILMDADSGAIMFQRNADDLVSPASMSKLMLLAVVFKALKSGEVKLTDDLLMSENSWRKGGAPSNTSSMFVPVGTREKLDELIKGIIVQSGNDAAMAVAENVGGSEVAFAKRMTDEARQIGLKKSVFKNSTGLYHPEHLMTVRELSILARHIIYTYPEYYPLFAMREYQYKKYKFINRNPLLNVVNGVDGLKTGFIKESGHGIVASAKQDNRRLIAVVNGAQSADDRRDDGRRLLEWGFRNFSEVKLFNAGEVVGYARVWGGDRMFVPLMGNGDVNLVLPKFPANQKVKAEIIYKWPLKPPLKKGDAVATLRITTSSEATSEAPLVVAEDVEKGGVMRRGLDSILHLATRWIP
jgi:serine-type D-Ala-D-Ala carboxypeptidase (penicillin-binding protein 5/6)